MPFWDKVKRNSDAARDELARRVSRFQNRQFLEGVIAAAALIIQADGKIADSEVESTILFLNSHPLLTGWSSDEKATLFRDYAVQAAGPITRIPLIGKVAAHKNNPDAAATLVELALALANADGDFAQAEKDVVTTIAKNLGLKPSDYVS